MIVRDVCSAAAIEQFAACARTICSLSARPRSSSKDSRERFEEKFMLSGDVVRLVLEEAGDRWSDYNNTHLRFNLPAVGRFIQRTKRFCNFCVALAAFAHRWSGGFS
jgi:hypothetical protein